MGLGAWIHATINPQIALGDPKFSRTYGRMLGFDFVTPRWRPADIWRWHIPLPKYAKVRSHPVRLPSPDGGAPLIAAACPPVVEYSAEFQERAAAEVEVLPADSSLSEMLSDYAVMRDQARVCGLDSLK